MRGMVAYIVIVGGFRVAICRESRISIAECLRRRIEINLARSLWWKESQEVLSAFRETRLITLNCVCIVRKSVLYYNVNSQRY